MATRRHVVEHRRDHDHGGQRHPIVTHQLETERRIALPTPVLVEAQQEGRDEAEEAQLADRWKGRELADHELEVVPHQHPEEPRGAASPEEREGARAVALMGASRRVEALGR